MKKTNSRQKENIGPTQRQLRAAENIRHVLVEIVARGDIQDPALKGVSLTIGEVRMSPDLRHANVFVSALGQSDAKEYAQALNKASAYLRGQMARNLDSKFTPKLKFIGDNSYDIAMHIDELLANPKVSQDLAHPKFRLADEED
jgi:ribosome-binding factor A